MADSEDTDVTNSPALSWRDVYKAVNDSQVTILKAIEDATKPIALSQADHETRLRKLELEGSTEARDAKRSVDALWIKHDALKVQVEANTNSRAGFLSALSAGQKVIVLLGTILGIVVSFIGLLNLYADALSKATQ